MTANQKEMSTHQTRESLAPLTFYLGTKEMLNVKRPKVFKPFDEKILSFLNTLSKTILKKAKAYPDLMTFGFWCRRASLEEQKKAYVNRMKNRWGRGLVFHIAPANVPINFAYSLAAGLLSGNANLVRLPSKKFEQVDLLIKLIKASLEEAEHQDLKACVILVNYAHSQKITEALSKICDTRMIWGGDQTIASIRKALLKPRATEITFADRYSMAIIDAAAYLNAEDKEKIAKDFYNDTYLTDQNACTAPKIIFWRGKKVDEAQEKFWERLNAIVQKEYALEAVQVVDKLRRLYQLGAEHEDVHQVKTENNKITRIAVKSIKKDWCDAFGNSGYFLEYRLNALKELLPLCESRCQTLAYYGIDPKEFEDFLGEQRPPGIDRVVPLGKTMDFSLVWDGVDLIEALTRSVMINE